MGRLQFDDKGYLMPYQPIEVDLETLKSEFVDSFPYSQNRRWLFENYLKFLYRFQDNIFPWFEQWVNGSFISQKNNPKDIDVVTFLDFEVWETRGDESLDPYWTFSLEDEKIDSYLVKVYPPEHPLYNDYLAQRENWLDRYSSSRADEFDIIYPKGFVSIIFGK